MTLPSTVLRTKGHRLSVTSAVAAESGLHLFTSGKEGHIIKWDLLTGKKITTFYKQRHPSDLKGKGKAKAKDRGPIQGHTDEVLALAVSGDGKILVSGGRDKRLVVWDVEKDSWEKCFYGPLAHKDAISVSHIPFYRSRRADLFAFFPRGYRSRKERDNSTLPVTTGQ